MTTPPRPAANRNRNRRQGSRAQAQKESQRRTRMIIIAVVGVVIAVAVVVAIVAGGGDKKTEPTNLGDANAIAAAMAAIPSATFDAVGVGAAIQNPTAYAGTPITKDGKPELLYIGAEYCPFCAAERWAMVAALSRFGTFSNLKLTTSAAEDVYPSTPTFSFYGATYTSEYLTFTTVETNTNQRKGSGYEPLQEITPEQQAIAAETGQGGIPFLAFGGKYYISGATLDPGVLAERNAPGIAQLLSDPERPLTKAVIGAANGIAAAICAMTNNQPATVCNSTGVQAAKTAIGIN